jgi:hypothetical protein
MKTEKIKDLFYKEFKKQSEAFEKEHPELGEGYFTDTEPEFGDIYDFIVDKAFHDPEGIPDHHRWYTITPLIVKVSGRYFRVPQYSFTENQYFEDIVDENEWFSDIVEVFPVKKTITVYSEKVEDNA